MPTLVQFSLVSHVSFLPKLHGELPDLTSSSFSTVFNQTPLPGFSSQQGLSPLHTLCTEGLPDAQIPGQLYLSLNTPDEWYHSINTPFSHFSLRGYSKCSKNFFEGHQRVDNCVLIKGGHGKKQQQQQFI